MLHHTDPTEFVSHIVPWWHVVIPAKYLARTWQFQNGQFLLPRLPHWDHGLKLRSDMLHHNHLTEFGSHIRELAQEPPVATQWLIRHVQLHVSTVTHPIWWLSGGSGMKS
jgi:hypothetical protein